MQTYEQVENYMKALGLRYFKNGQEFITGLAIKTDKNFAKEVAEELNARAEGAPKDSADFYALKNRTLDGSLYISAAFDGGVFRHIGNMVMDAADMFKGEVLDLCCDCGVVTCFMAQCYPEVKFTGVDINEAAVNNAKELAGRLNITNAEFICSDVYELDLGRQFDCVTSFRSLLDAADRQTKGLNYIGERGEREKTYEAAFTPFAEIVAKHLKDGGFVLSVERYTAEYGWLGWLQALEAQGIRGKEGCELMRAQDISSVKEYSVTYAVKGEGLTAAEAFNAALAKDFKSGTGYEGSLAEVAVYYDSEGEIEICEIRNRKSGRIIHQFAFADSKSGKRIYYDASNDKRKVKYYNPKKEENIRKDYNAKLALYDENIYEIKSFNL